MAERRPSARVAKAAAEFFLIVTGVLTALTIETWNGYRLDRLREREYLQLLLADTESHVEVFDSWLRGFEERIEVANALWLYASTDERASLTPAALFAAIYSGGNYSPPRLFRDATYQELLSSGSLQLIRSKQLRAALMDYYARRTQDLAWMDETADQAHDRWNEVASGLLPSSLRRASYEGTTMTPADFESALRGLAREDVKQGIMYMLSTLEDQKFFTERQRDSARTLVSALRAELDKL